MIPNSQASWPQARRGMAKIGAATLLFALWHSILCSDGAKNGARAVFGVRRGTAFYRAFFMAQAVLTSGALVLTIFKQPHRVLYRARGAARLLGWAGQAGALVIFALGMLELDKAKFLGIQGVRDFKNDAPIAEAQAQGPELEADSAVRARGIFRYSRHPLEWAPALLLLASPTMKTNWLVFDVLTAIYSFLGALHEEERLTRQSENYAAYQKQVAFFFGKPKS